MQTKISDKLDFEFDDWDEESENFVTITEHTEDGYDEFVVIALDEIPKLIELLQKAHLTKRAADASPESPLKNKRQVAKRR